MTRPESFLNSSSRVSDVSSFRPTGSVDPEVDPSVSPPFSMILASIPPDLLMLILLNPFHVLGNSLEDGTERNLDSPSNSDPPCDHITLIPNPPPCPSLCDLPNLPPTTQLHSQPIKPDKLPGLQPIIPPSCGTSLHPTMSYRQSSRGKQKPIVETSPPSTNGILRWTAAVASRYLSSILFHSLLPTSQCIIARPLVPSPANQSPPPGPLALTPITSSVTLSKVDLDLIPSTSLGAPCPSTPFVPLSDVQVANPLLDQIGVQPLEDLNWMVCHRTPNGAVVLIDENEALIISSSPIFLRSTRYGRPSERLRMCNVFRFLFLPLLRCWFASWADPMP
ncbi:hypothetical protein NE237_031317 [Protea cynaroides]|uniref:Uncharacterized protein n=1 Tax=Protea cynaroides TaxID=273540 RepID=A0A9Q0L1D1_9MAGN|nr:hypothetical protein NE237_031317 [Protea cynaroides]